MMNEHELYGDPNPESVEMLSARRAALELLEKVLIQKQPLDSVLEKAVSFKSRIG